MGEKGKNFFSLFSFLSFIRNYSEEMAFLSEGIAINSEGMGINGEGMAILSERMGITSEEMAITSEGIAFNGEGIYKAGRCGARGSMWGLNVEGNRPSVVVFGGEIFQALFDGCCDVSLHGEFGRHTLHLWGMVAQQLLVDVGAVFGFHQHHVYLEIGNDKRAAVCICELYAFINGAIIAKVYCARRSIRICLWLGLEIRC